LKFTRRVSRGFHPASSFVQSTCSMVLCLGPSLEVVKLKVVRGGLNDVLSNMHALT
jgi:hypothetical protein